MLIFKISWRSQGALFNTVCFVLYLDLCGLNTYLREPSGVVSSPNFPSNYGAGRNCLWTIIAPPGYRVQFTIHWLGIEDHRYSRPGSCGDDSISISEYRGNYTNDVTVLCGCKRLFAFVSFMDIMWVRFSSYKKNNWPGFYATYNALGEFLRKANDSKLLDEYLFSSLGFSSNFKLPICIFKLSG